MDWRAGTDYRRTDLLSLHHCCMDGHFGIVRLLLFTIFPSSKPITGCVNSEVR